MKFYIVHMANVNDLSKLVQRYIDEGWEVLGYPFVDPQQNICQAMIKDKK